MGLAVRSGCGQGPRAPGKGPGALLLPTGDGEASQVKG